MKRNILPVMTLALLASAGSCMSLDENLITGVSSQYYSTSDGLNSAVVASYAQMRIYGLEPIGSLTQLGTDTWMVGDQGDVTATMRNIDSYGSQFNSNAGELSFFWNSNYQLINNLNAALDRGPNTPGLATSVKNALLGEAHFMRAYAYFNLVQHFGDVTLSVHENQGVQVAAVRSPQDSVYLTILADLDTAVSQLPVTQADFGRATRGAALTLRSKVYLTRAYKSFGRGAADFTAALADANAVIASNAYTLEPVYADLWCVARAADPGRSGFCENTNYNQNRREFIFTVQYNYTQRDADVGGALQYNYQHLVFLGQYDNANAGVGIARDKNNGRPFRRFKPTQFELSLWNTRYAGTPGASPVLDTRFDGSFQTVWSATAGGNTNPAGASATTVPRCPSTPLPVAGLLACASGGTVNVGDTTILYTTYPVDSIRRKASKYTIRHTCPAGLADPSVYCGDNSGQNNGYIGFDRYPSLKKFQDNARTAADINDQNGGKVLVLFRFAEVYLIAAEANLGLNQLGAAAANINTLRVRAANNPQLTAAQRADPAYVAALTAFTNVPSAQVTLDFIMDERERELAGEFNRWYDIARPGPTFMQARVKKWNPKAVNLVAKHIVRPIPQSQIDGVVQGPAYPQNTGY